MKEYDSAVIKKSILQEKSDRMSGVEFVESDDWTEVSECGTQSKVYIFRDVTSKKTYAVVDYREWNEVEGNYTYFSDDWEGNIECPEVKKKKALKKEWVVIR